jgi:site-specific DNA-methyltransferase (adenine-specific)
MQLYQGDCLEVMKQIPNKSVDMILCDLPYGTTACKWDTIIPFDKLWEQYNRIIKDNGAVVLFGQEPFSSQLRVSNLKMYRYDWVWEKERLSNVLCVKWMCGKIHENIMVFYKKKPTFNPQMKRRTGKKITPNKPKFGKIGSLICSSGLTPKSYIDNGERYPTSIIKFSRDILKSNLHPTQKPVALCEYLIKTYTNAGDTVLDNCMGSGTTGVACKHLDRNFIGIELDPKYFEIAKNRIESELL